MFKPNSTVPAALSSDSHPLRFVQAACDIVGFPWVDEASSPESGLTGSFRLVHALSGRHPIIEICYDQQLHELLLQATIGTLSFPSDHALLQLALKSQVLLMTSGMCLFIHPLENQLCLRQQPLSMHQLDLAEAARHIARLADTALAWHEQMEKTYAY